MDIKCSRHGECVTAHINGELDHHTAPKLRRQLDELISSKEIKVLELDLKGLGFMDSSGIGLIIGRYKQLKKRGGCVYVTNVGTQTDKLLRASGMYQILIKK